MQRVTCPLLILLLALGILLPSGCGGKNESTSNKNDGNGTSKTPGENGSRSNKSTSNQRASSQTSDNQAVVAFEIDFERLMGSPLAKALPVDQGMNMLPPDAKDSLQDLKQVRGFLSAPPDVASLAVLDSVEPPSELPADFFIEIEFHDAEACAQLVEQVKADSEPFTHDGETYYAAPPGGPPVVAYVRSDRIVEVGTRDYMLRSSRDYSTDALEKTWKSMPPAAVRLAIDMEAARPFLGEATEMLGEQVPPQIRPFLALVDKADSLSIAFDLQADDLLVVRALGTDRQEVADIKQIFDALIGTAQVASAPAIEMMQENQPAMADIVKTVSETLSAKVSGNQVELRLPKPDGIDAAMENAMQRARSAARSVSEANRFRQFGLAIHHYHDAYRAFPINQPESGPDGKLSWRVRILPFMEETRLYDQFDLHSDWDSESNRPLADKLPKSYGTGGPGINVCWVLPDNPPLKLGNITDGTANTIMLIQTTKPIPVWTKPHDLTIDQVVDMVKNLPDGEELVAVFYDAHIERISNQIDEAKLRSMLHPTDGK